MMAANHIIYLTLCIIVTIGVGHTLHQHGRPFLVHVFHGNERTADAVNHLLLAGFYLLNIGLAATVVKLGGTANDLRTSLELLSVKVGWIVLFLGCMHCNNVFILLTIRRRVLSRPMEIVEFFEK